jgi:membrane dipeptidase
MTYFLDRRAFLQTAAFAALAAAVKGQTAAKTTPFPFVDGLCLDLPDDGVIKSSGLSGFLLDVSEPEEIKGPDGSSRWIRSYSATVKKMNGLREELGKRAVALHTTDGRQIVRAFKENKTAVFFQVQGGGEMVGEDLGRIEGFRDAGLRVLQLTHHHNNPLAGGGIEKDPSGLTKLGYEAIARLNAADVIADMSHASDFTALDSVKASKEPVILSHGACRAFVNNARCAPDNVIRAIADSGGVMGIFMMSFWLTTDPVPTVDHYVKQIKHVLKVGGINAVGIANDFPLTGESGLVEAKGNNAVAVKNYFAWWDSIAKMGVLGFDRRPEHVAIPELNDIGRAQRIHQALEASGFKSTELEKIMGGNWIRVLSKRG